MILLAHQDGVVNQRLGEYLADVAERFAGELRSDLTCVNELVGHIERYRGKMLRPTLVLISSIAVGADDEDAISTTDAHRVLATVVEMVHMATLVHDDILDEAEMRRRGATINNLSGNETAVMLGDYLISHAYHLCSSIGRTDISRAVAAATNVVCEGELLQLSNRNNFELDEATYFEIIRRKTASLCGLCCRLSAELSPRNLGPGVSEALRAYGEKLGIAFQIIDDVLDLTGDQDKVGKTLGRDLEKGKLTLPLIHHLNSADAGRRDEMRGLLDIVTKRIADESDPTKVNGNGNGKVSVSSCVSQIRELLQGGESIGYARARAKRLVDQAKAAICETLPESDARSIMLSMADAVLSREY